jgi:hypothetical protein
VEGHRNGLGEGHARRPVSGGCKQRHHVRAIVRDQSGRNARERRFSADGLRGFPYPVMLSPPEATQVSNWGAVVDIRQLAAVAGAALDDLESPLDFEADDEVSVEDSVEVRDFFVSPFDEPLPDPARLSVR